MKERHEIAITVHMPTRPKVPKRKAMTMWQAAAIRSNLEQ
jgi:hypothetical protein